MANKQYVIDLHQQHPDWTPTQIADALGCSSGYVRATGRRLGLTFAAGQIGRPRGVRFADIALGRACRELGITLRDILDLAEGRRHRTQSGSSLSRTAQAGK